MTRTGIALAALLLGPLTMLAMAAQADAADVGRPQDRPDRLIAVEGPRDAPWLAAYSTDGGATWRPATMYVGADAEEWRATDPETWNAGVLTGRLPAGTTTCLWNYFFDLEPDVGPVRSRLIAEETGAAILEQDLRLDEAPRVVVVDHRNVRELSGGTLPGQWELAPSGVKEGSAASITQRIAREKIPSGNYYSYNIANADPTPLTLHAGLKGWHRIYVGMEPYSTVRLWLSGDDVRYETPNYYADDTGKGGASTRRLCQEFFIASADLTGQDVCIAPGGSRFWRDVSVRYLRLVPMTRDEVAHFQEVRAQARSEGRPFAGYLEPCTPAHYEPQGSMSLRGHIRNEMRLNRARGSTDVYMHVIRIGSKAWYHSDVVERGTMSGWMAQGDAMAIGVEEAHAHGLRFFADAGMNATYYGSDKDMTARFARDHPEYLVDSYKMCFDYRHGPVQDYVTSVLRELMTKYDVDGVHLDFGRWGHRAAYDQASLRAVLERVDADRRAAKTKWGHPILISARVDHDDPPAEGADETVFLGALKAWARAGHVDRVMVNVYKKLAPTTPLRHYVQALEGTSTELWGDLYWGTWPKPDGGPMKDLAIAQGWVAQGLNGGFFYYMRARPIEWECINWQLRLVDASDVFVDPHHRFE